ncbi:MAG TPA: WYL domain-containing protein [Gammaproteobacteria bacterium]|jgi:predicted DNA-binding transcriptional regulator YafY|nr:WYL domain-containing protein [Gammaproteobacteria bacterium]
MDRTERLYRIDRLLQGRGAVPVTDFLEELGISLATFKRDLEYLRDRLNAPIVWDRDAGGYRFDQQGAGDKYELPGLWFNASEIHALLTMQQLLKDLEPGLLGPHVEPLLARLRLLLDRENMPADAVQKRIRVQRVTARAYDSGHFAPIATAVLQRRRLVVDHYHRARDELLRREISPQRLTYYRENWYLDAWCHLRNGLRSFALDAIRGVWISNDKAKEVPAKEIDAALDSGYGIFSGHKVQWAELKFSPERARWVSHERWHTEQSGWFADDGCYHLQVPFSDPRELVMDILRHVPEVTVVAPATLRKQVLEQLQLGASRI